MYINQVNAFVEYCSNNFLVPNVSKTKEQLQLLFKAHDVYLLKLYQGKYVTIILHKQKNNKKDISALGLHQLMCWTPELC